MLYRVVFVKLITSRWGGMRIVFYSSFLCALFMVIPVQSFIFTELALIIGAVNEMNKRNRQAVYQAFQQARNQQNQPEDKKDDGQEPYNVFADLGGDLPQEVQEIIEFIADADRFYELGAYMPKGILLEGPPGTGKTTIARCIAAASGAAFLAANGSEFVDLYVGQGPRNVRELFNSARDAIKFKGFKKVVIFIDEIDAVGRKRGGAHSQEYDNTVNALLNEMDGFAQDPGIFVIGATNHAQSLDEALIRPGRFDRTVKIGLPDLDSRVTILKLYVQGNKMQGGSINGLPKVRGVIDYTALARQMHGWSGADLKNVVNEAAIRAARRKSPAVEHEDFEEALSVIKKVKRAQKRR